MKRIYVSFFTTVTVAVVMTLIAFWTRDEATGSAGIKKDMHVYRQDTTLSAAKKGSEGLN